MTHVFGPVHSVRLGRLICVDLVPLKVCNFDCVYCEYGRTTTETIMRDRYLDFAEVTGEIEQRLDSRPDYIALTGCGEPLIHAQLNQLMQHIRAVTDVPIAVLSNGGMFWRADCRAEMMDADILLPSLDAGDNATLHAVNRPHARISVDDIIDGLVRFRRAFRKPLWLRVTLVGGFNDSPRSLDRIRRAVRRINPDKVQLRAADCLTCADAGKIPAERLRSIAAYFGPAAEIIEETATVDREHGFDPRAHRQIQGAAS